MEKENGFSLEELESKIKIDIPQRYKEFILNYDINKYHNSTYPVHFKKRKLRFGNLKEIILLCYGGPWEQMKYAKNFPYLPHKDEISYLYDKKGEKIIYFPIAMFNMKKDKYGEGSEELSFIALDTRKSELPVVEIYVSHDLHDIYVIEKSFDNFLSQLILPESK